MATREQTHTDAAPSSYRPQVIDPTPTTMLDGASARLRELRDSLGNLTGQLCEYANRTFGTEPTVGAAGVKQERPQPSGAIATLFDDIENLERMRDSLQYEIERFRALA